MPPASLFRLHSVSVVITAESHNPSILTKEFLEASGLMPDGWVVSEAINLPPLSLLRFGAKGEWVMDASRMSISENCESSFQNSYQIHHSVIEYLHKVEHVPYRSLGLNCIVSMESDDPRGWLFKRFLKAGPWESHDPRLVSMLPKFTFEAGDAILNLLFTDQIVKQGQVQNAVTVDCNLHYEGPLNAVELRDAIARWKNHQDRIIEVLDMLSGRQQT